MFNRFEDKVDGAIDAVFVTDVFRTVIGGLVDEHVTPAHLDKLFYSGTSSLTEAVAARRPETFLVETDSQGAQREVRLPTITDGSFTRIAVGQGPDFTERREMLRRLKANPDTRGKLTESEWLRVLSLQVAGMIVPTRVFGRYELTDSGLAELQTVRETPPLAFEPNVQGPTGVTLSCPLPRGHQAKSSLRLD